MIRDATTEILVSVTTQFGCDKPPEVCCRPENLPYLDENQQEFSDNLNFPRDHRDFS